MNTNRFKNPYFWIGLIGVIFTAMGADPATLTSWGAVKDCIITLFSNPYMIGSVIISVLGVFINPTTKGVKD